jgi:hypothetical protein
MPDELKHEIQEALDDATPEAIEWHMVRHPETPWGKAQGETRYVVWSDSGLAGGICHRCTWEDTPPIFRESVGTPGECTCGQLGEPAVDEAWSATLEGLADQESVCYRPKPGWRLDEFENHPQGEVCWLQDRWLWKWYKPGEWPTSEEYTDAEVRAANLAELKRAQEWVAGRPQRKVWLANVMAARDAMNKAAADEQ